MQRLSPVSTLPWTLSSEALDSVVLPTHGTDTEGRSGVKHWPMFSSVRKVNVMRRKTRGDRVATTREGCFKREWRHGRERERESGRGIEGGGESWCQSVSLLGINTKLKLPHFSPETRDEFWFKAKAWWTSAQLLSVLENCKHKPYNLLMWGHINYEVSFIYLKLPCVTG